MDVTKSFFPWNCWTIVKAVMENCNKNLSLVQVSLPEGLSVWHLQSCSLLLWPTAWRKRMKAAMHWMTTSPQTETTKKSGSRKSFWPKGVLCNPASSIRWFTRLIISPWFSNEWSLCHTMSVFLAYRERHLDEYIAVLLDNVLVSGF